jgi:peptide/nickel transport system ATP-binding protein
MIFQGSMNALNPVIRVGDLLTEVLQNHEQVSKEEAQNRIAELFKSVGLPANRISAYPHEMSGGMRQRTVIAMSLLCNPDLVIADEPTTAFDVVVQDQVLGMIENLQERFGLGMILITHDIAVVAETCHRVVVMYAGEIVEEGIVEDIFNDPRHPYTRALLDAVPSLTGPRYQLQSLPGNPPSLIGEPLPCAFATRCPISEDICLRQSPLYMSIGQSVKHNVRCHFANDLERLDKKKRGAREQVVRPYPLTEADMKDEQPILQLEGVTKFYYPRQGMVSSMLGAQQSAVRAVDGVDLRLRQGEILSLVGESGSGKSTLARLICGLESPNDGKIMFRDEDISGFKGNSLKELRRQMQMVFQDPYDSLDPRETVYETVVEPLEIHGVRKEEWRERVSNTLEEVELRPHSRYTDRFPHELSGGERQRVALARAIILRPSLVVADEPVSMVDASVRAGLINLMLRLHKDLGITYIFVTHDLSVARHIADRIAIMYLGRIVEIGSAIHVIKDPKHPYTHMLISAIAVPQPGARRHRVRAIGEPQSANEIPSGCRFHPRCPRAQDKCKSQDPLLEQLAPHRSVACFYPLKLDSDQSEKERDTST